MADTYSKKHKDNIKKAIIDFENHTCINFIEKSAYKGKRKTVLKIKDTPNRHCSASIGYNS